MYPGTIIQWHNQSQILPLEPASVDNAPLFLHLSSFDKGKEELTEISGEAFYKMYGQKMKFDCHGQPAIQAANIINNGGRLLVKRLVAKDAKLANLIAVATVKSDIEVHKTDESDPNGATLEQLLTGVTTEKTYAAVLEFTSKAATEVGKTQLTIEKTLSDGQKFVYKATESDLLPALGTKITEADGYEDLAEDKVVEIPDETKIAVAVYSDEEGITAYGTVTAVSRLADRTSTGTVPTNGLEALNVTSREGSSVGHTILTMSPAKSEGNSYYYRKAVGKELEGEVDGEAYTDNGVSTDDHNITFFRYNEWTKLTGDSQSEDIEIEDGALIVVVEAKSELTAKNPSGVCNVVRATEVAVSSRIADERENESTGIEPATDFYTVIDTVNTIKWTAMSVQNCLKKEEVIEAAHALYTNDAAVETVDEETAKIVFTASYPLVIISDNGRGLSNKAVRFVNDMTTSKDLNTMMYNASIFEGTSEVDASLCTLNPSYVFNNKLYGINEDTSNQVVYSTIPGVYESFVQYISEITGYEVDVLNKCDLITMVNNRGLSLEGITFDTESVDFGAPYGVPLQNGDNGEFGEAPFGTDAWAEAACAVIDECIDLWDPDTRKIYAIFDANYPEPVKDKLAWFASQREDTMFCRDYGLDVFSYASINEKCHDISSEYKNFFNAEYFTTYEIYDPETKVRERVTMMYDFAAAMVDHFARGAFRPVAGVVNGMILPSAIEGTINFTPYKMPNVNQKALIDDLRVNYAIFHEGQCVVQSTYTADNDYSQCSFINNILAVEEVIRAVRIACPKQRFRFVTNNDFSVYAEAVNNVLKGFRSNFAYLQFEYTQDRLKASQKIFDAGIYFRFNNWEQTEYFNIYCLGDEV